MEKGTALSGMKEITEFCGQIGLQRTDSSVLKLKLQYGFPMKKLLGIWASDKLLIEEWRRKYISGEVETQPVEQAKANRKADRTRW